MINHDDFAVEPIPGLPAELPAGETLLWQGKPDWKVFARRVFRLRVVMAYFAILAVWRGIVIAHDGGTLWDALSGASILAVPAAIALALFVGLSMAIARTTVYTITSRRLVFRFGVALPMAVNLPFTSIDGASLKALPGGHGDIALTLGHGHRVAYLAFWPHARPWRFTRAEPMLRCVPNAAEVAGLLARAFAAAETNVVRTGLVEQASPAVELGSAPIPAAG